ncbi:MAG: SDR family oxidoreductase [Gaiellales bacterium]
MTFAGKTVLVTGGSRGIGKTIALRFAGLGASRVGIGYLRSDRDAEQTARELEALGAEPVLLRGNVGDPQRLRAMLDTLGTPDVLVANAATGVIRKTLELEEKHWDWTLNANARSLFTLARLAAPRMAPGSSIVALSSLGSMRVLDDYVLVGVSKAAIEALVRYLAVELAPLGIRANAVSAGLVDTGALDHFPDRDAMLAHYRERTPAGRLVEPADIAEAVCYLASPAAEMIRGHTLILDGGYSLVT